MSVPPGGTAPRVMHIATVDMTFRFLLLPMLLHLKARGFEVQAASAAGPWREEIGASGISVHTANLTRRVTPFQDLLALYQLYGLLRRQRPAIVHTHTPKANLLGRMAARLARVPIVIGMEHGFYFANKSGANRAFHVALARLGACLSDMTIVINREDELLARSRGIVAPKKLFCLDMGLGVDLQRFTTEPNGKVFRARLGIGLETPLVGFAGRQTREKGCFEFLRAAALVRDALPETHFVVAGLSEGRTQGKLEQLAKRLHMAERVHFLGLRKDMPDLYAAIDLVVLPSYREGVGMVLEEAAASGKPAVTTDIRGCKEVVVDGETGLLVPPRDVEHLALAILDLLKDKERRLQMGRTARLRAETHFDQEKKCREVEELYCRLLQQKGIRHHPPCLQASN